MPFLCFINTGKAEEGRIVGDFYHGCTELDYFNKIDSYHQVDMDAWIKTLSAGLENGKCIQFKNGEEVLIIDSLLSSHRIKVCRKGQTKEYWTFDIAVKKLNMNYDNPTEPITTTKVSKEKPVEAKLESDNTKVLAIREKERKEAESTVSSKPDSEDKTLGEIRKELLGEEVVIRGVKATGLGQFQGEDVFLEWHLAEGNSQTGFKQISTLYAPYRFKGSNGIVESIEIAESFFKKRKRGTSTDVFGDTIRDDDVSDPYFEIVVKLHNGILLISTGYFNTIMGHKLELVSKVDMVKNEISKNIDSLIGKTIFPVAYSIIFPPDADLKDITDSLQRDFNKMRDVPNLTPLKIIKAKYLENENGLLLKVEFLGDRNGIIFSEFPSDKSSQKWSFLTKATSGFRTEIPKKLTTKEVEAIRGGSIFRGMSLDALHYSFGFPKKENNWGRGGKQLIYGERMFVYIESDKVVDWQLLSK